MSERGSELGDGIRDEDFERARSALAAREAGVNRPEVSDLEGLRRELADLRHRLERQERAFCYVCDQLGITAGERAAIVDLAPRTHLTVETPSTMTTTTGDVPTERHARAKP